MLLLLIVPALALVAAGIAAIGSVLRPDSPATSPGADGPSPGTDDASIGAGEVALDPELELVPGLSARTRSWAAELDQVRGGVPLPFLLRWVQRESDGDPCSLGSIYEVGIGQLNTQDGPQFGYTREQLHPDDCANNVDRAAQVGSLVAMCSAYIMQASNRLDARGLSWRGSDVLCMAKLIHALPVLTTVYLSDATNKDQAKSWSDFRAYLEALPRAEAVALWGDIGRYYPLSRYTRNASYTATGVE